MANVNPTLKRLFGRAGFSYTATLEWYRYEFPPIEVTGVDAEGNAFTRQATFVLSANTRRYGGDAVLSPFADPDDDLLDLVLFTSKDRGDLFQFYRLLPDGRARQLGVRGVTRFPVRSFTARSLAGYELAVQVDGDGAGSTPVTVGPAAGKVRLLVPSR
jgi:diacylglycerol kinase family enzyme